MYSEMRYHHRLHKPDLLSITASIPAIRLERKVVHPKRIKLPILRFLHRLQSVVPQSIVALGEDLAGGLEMTWRVRAYP